MKLERSLLVWCVIGLHLEALALEHVGVEDLNGVHDTGDLFSLVVRDVEAEVFLHGEHEFNSVQRVEAEVLKSGRTRELFVIALGCGLEHFKDFALDEFYQFVVVQALTCGERTHGKHLLAMRLSQKHRGSQCTLGKARL